MSARRPVVIGLCTAALSGGVLPAHADDPTPAAEEATPAAGVAQNAHAWEMLNDRLSTSDSYKVRAQAAVLLGRLGDPRAVTPLVHALEYDEHYAVRAAAATGLGSLGDDKGVEPLFAATSDPEPIVRDSAARALGRVDARRNFTLFMRFARGESADQRRVAVGRLGDLARTGDAEATEVLVASLGDEPDVRDAAAAALMDLPTDRAVPILLGGLQHDQASVRAEAARLLGPRQGRHVVEALAAAYDKPGEQERVRAEVRRALERQRPNLNLSEITDQARSAQDKQARARAIRLLGVVGDPRTADTLEELLFEDDPYIQGIAALALADLGSMKSIPRLEQALKASANTRAAAPMELAVKKLKRLKEQSR